MLGVPARAGNLNSETDFVLKKFAVGVPKLYSDLAQRSADAGSPIESVCLMDHNQMSQVPDGVDLAKAENWAKLWMLESGKGGKQIF